MIICKKCGSERESQKCTACQRARSSAWYYANKQKVLEKTRKWQADNPAKVIAAKKKYNEKNPGKEKEASARHYVANKNAILEKQKEYRSKNYLKIKEYFQTYRALNKRKNAEYYSNNREKFLALAAIYRQENPAARKLWAANRRARKLENGGKLSAGITERLYELQRGNCACCGLPLGENYHLDHIMPIALGGANEDWNIQLLRATCNHQKHAKHPVAFMQSRGFLL